MFASEDMLRKFIVGILIAILCFSCVDGKEIASARIHLVLLVPPDPITTETSEGDYGEYQVQRDGNVMYVMAK